jgi:hypothetical protein
VRSDNVRALLVPTDPRRIVFKEPDADTALQEKRKKLSDYLDDISVAHETCRRTNELATCVKATREQSGEVPLTNVEIPPVMPPGFTTAIFAIDGSNLGPGLSEQLISSFSTTLYDAARLLKPDAANVDLLVEIPSFYIASTGVQSVQADRALNPSILGSAELVGPDLTLPSYFPRRYRSGNGILFFHGDAQHPCPIRQVQSLQGQIFKLIDESCLTSAGRLIKRAVLSNVTNTVFDPSSPARIDQWVPGVMKDCFGNAVRVSYGEIAGNISRMPQSTQIAYRYFVPVDGRGFMLFAGTGQHPLNDWMALKQQRVADLSSYRSPSGPGACVPHIP